MRTEFVGRQEELAWLRSQFDACATRGADGQYGGPRMAFVIAESGIGKSRLVQELYLQLANDSQWDPPDVDYWPDSFTAKGSELHVVPDMTGHEAKGPPRFAWVGARWHPTEDRNVQVRRSILPELRSSLIAHAEILRAHQSLWQDASNRIAVAVRKDAAGEVIGEVVGQVADQLLPFGGLLITLGSGVKEFLIDRRTGPQAFEEITNSKLLSDADEVLDCFRRLLNVRAAVPVVLWLDDAQWIDGDTLLFLGSLWNEASRQHWPLLVVVAHWEREWRELAQRNEATTLHNYSGLDNVSEWRLQATPDSCLTECLKKRLPGLDASQVTLMVEKAAGNFLQLIEIIEEMAAEPMNFLDEQLEGPLTDEAVERLHEFECDREARVRQRFKQFESDVKKILGWSSQLGHRFLSEVVESFAKERLRRDNAKLLIDRCVDPYVVLDRTSHFTREFRDRVFHKVATEFRHQYLLKDADQLSAVLRSCLVEWISNTVAAELSPSATNADTRVQRRLNALPHEERRDILGIAMEELPPPSSLDWTNHERVAGFWAICLAIADDCRQRLWGRVGAHVDRLRGICWSAVPLDACSRDTQGNLCDAAIKAGRLSVAHNIAVGLLARDRLVLTQEETPGRLLDVSFSLNRLGDIARLLGRRDESLTRYKESLEMRRRLLTEKETPERLGYVLATLNRIGTVAGHHGDLAYSLICHKDALAISQRLLTEEATQDRLEGLSICLTALASTLRKCGKLDEALMRYEEALEISRRLLTEQETAKRLMHCSVILNEIGFLARERGNLAAAAARYQESLEIIRRLLDEEETPKRLWHLSISLTLLADISRLSERWHDALAQEEESLAINQRLLAEEVTTLRLSAVSFALWHIGVNAKQLGQWDYALKRHEESLAIRRRLLSEEEAPHNLQSVSDSLHEMGVIANALGQLDQAFVWLEEALAIRRRLLAEKETPDRLYGVLAILDELAAIAGTREQWANAQSINEESLAMRRSLLVEQETPERLLGVSCSLKRLGIIAKRRGNSTSARASYEESLAIDRRLLREDESLMPLLFAGASLGMLGDIAHACGQPEQALVRYEECLSLTAQAASRGCSRNDIAVFLVALDNICEMHGTAMMPSAVFEATSRCLAYVESLIAIVGDDVTSSNSIATFWELRASAAAATGDSAKAATASQRAKGFRDRLAELQIQ